MPVGPCIYACFVRGVEQRKKRKKDEEGEKYRKTFTKSSKWHPWTSNHLLSISQILFRTVDNASKEIDARVARILIFVFS